MSKELTAVMTKENEEQVRKEISVLVTKAQALTITTEMENTEALKLVASYKAEIKRRKGMDVYVKAVESKRASTEALKSLTALMIDPLSESVDIMSAKAGEFVKLENARRAELQRIEDEKAAEAMRKEEARIAAAEAKGKTIFPKYVAPPRVIASVSTPAGTSMTTRWSAQVVDKMLFLQAVIAGEEPAYMVDIVMPELNARATACKQEGKEIAPGIIAVSKLGTMSR